MVDKIVDRISLDYPMQSKGLSRIEEMNLIEDMRAQCEDFMYFLNNWFEILEKNDV